MIQAEEFRTIAAEISRAMTLSVCSDGCSSSYLCHVSAYIYNAHKHWRYKPQEAVPRSALGDIAHWGRGGVVQLVHTRIDTAGDVVRRGAVQVVLRVLVYVRDEPVRVEVACHRPSSNTSHRASDVAGQLTEVSAFKLRRERG